MFLKCSSYSVLMTYYIIRTIFNIICILVPVVLAILIMLQISKIVFEDGFDAQKIISAIRNKFIGAIILIFLPTIVFAFNKIVSGNNDTCWSEATPAGMASAKKEADKKLTTDESEYQKYKNEREKERQEKLEALASKEKAVMEKKPPKIDSTPKADNSGTETLQIADGLDYLQWAIAFSEDNSHGYLSPFGSSNSANNGVAYSPSYNYANGGTEVSCSGFVGLAITKSNYNGVSFLLNDGNQGYVGLGSQFESLLYQAGFEAKGAISTDTLQPGDVLIMNNWAHVAIYVGNGNLVDAAWNYDSRIGDSGGDEIAVHGFSWQPTAVYRLPDDVIKAHTKKS